MSVAALSKICGPWFALSPGIHLTSSKQRCKSARGIISANSDDSKEGCAVSYAPWHVLQLLKSSVAWLGQKGNDASPSSSLLTLKLQRLFILSCLNVPATSSSPLCASLVTMTNRRPETRRQTSCPRIWLATWQPAAPVLMTLDLLCHHP